MKKHTLLALGANLAVALSVLPMAALAQRRDVGAIADGIATQVGQANAMITILIFVIGVVMATLGLLKFHAHSKNPNDPSNKMSTAFILMFVGAALVAIPAILGTGIQTIWGGGAQQTDVTTGFTSVN